VSKAAVSKWETEVSYPDILLLPRLASCFDISIDELMGYEPQMERERIRKVYRTLAEEFTTQPFDQVIENCRKYVRKYYSCYPLLFQIASLFANHFTLAQSNSVAEQVLEYCLLVLKRPEEVTEILETEVPLQGTPGPLLASAWKMLGNMTEAKKILQTEIYKNILAFISLMSSYMELCTDEPKKFEESCRRFLTVAEAFRVDELHPGVLLPCYITMAQGLMEQGEKERALEILERYTDLATGKIYPIRLRGDAYFDLLDDWFEQELGLGDYPPRDEAIIRHSMTQAVAENLMFAAIADDPRFLDMTERLKKNECGV
jgi:tetratricopeptide (TPR) repeat protein